MRTILFVLLLYPGISLAESYSGTARNNYDYRESASSEAQKDIPSGKSSYKVSFSISFKNNKAIIKSKTGYKRVLSSKGSGVYLLDISGPSNGCDWRFITRLAIINPDKIKWLNSTSADCLDGGYQYLSQNSTLKRVKK